MLISDRHEFIFVHNRKVAGTSVRRRLAPFALSKPRGFVNKLRSRAGFQRDYRRHVFRKHAPLVHAQRRMGRERFRRYFKFAFVRNPWDRLVSEYEFIRRFPGHSRHRRVVAMEHFSEFVHYQSRRRDAYQINLMVDLEGELALDFVGRFEALERDFERICRRIGVQVDPLPHLNRSTDHDYRDYYDGATAAFVAEHWRREIELFGYDFDASDRS